MGKLLGKDRKGRRGQQASMRGEYGLILSSVSHIYIYLCMPPLIGEKYVDADADNITMKFSDLLSIR